ncbi:hypothetical protein J6590_052411 [Homalodisca vitripennis]|nr:hypothetical protein J6590_052411 [Homalodisca vitripennis]
MLSNVPSTTICVWSSQRLVDVDFDLLMRFSQANKTVMSQESLLLHSLPEDCLHNVMLWEKQKCTWHLPPTKPLSVLHSFYMLVEEDWPRQCSEQFGSARVVLVLLREARVLSLSSPLFRPRRFVSSNLTFNFKTSYDRPTNLNGADLIVATFHCPPFVMFDKGNPLDLDAITGNEWEIVKTLSIHYNFTMKLVKLKGDGEWGIAVNGTAIGGITQALADGEADIGVCNIWNVITRYSVMDFGPVMNEVTFTYIVPRPHLIPHQWHSLVNIFTVEMWFCTLAMYLFSTLCYWLFCNSCSSQTPVKMWLCTLAMYLFSTLCYWLFCNSCSSQTPVSKYWNLNIFSVEMWLCILAMYLFSTLCYWLFCNSCSSQTPVSKYWNLNIFSVEMWLCILAMYLFSTLCYWLFCNSCSSQTPVSKYWKLNIFTVEMWLCTLAVYLFSTLCYRLFCNSCSSQTPVSKYWNLNIFSVEMWLCILAMYLFSTLCYWLFCNSCSSQTPVSKYWKLNIFTVEMWLCTLAMYLFSTLCYWLFCNSCSSQTPVSKYWNLNIVTVEMWLCILAMYLFSTLCYWLFCNSCSSQTPVSKYWKLNIFTVEMWLCTLTIYLCSSQTPVSPVESMLTIFGILTLTSWAVRTPTAVAVLWCCVFGVGCCFWFGWCGVSPTAVAAC